MLQKCPENTFSFDFALTCQRRDVGVSNQFTSSENGALCLWDLARFYDNYRAFLYFSNFQPNFQTIISAKTVMKAQLVSLLVPAELLCCLSSCSEFKGSTAINEELKHWEYPWPAARRRRSHQRELHWDAQWYWWEKSKQNAGWTEWEGTKNNFHLVVWPIFSLLVNLRLPPSLELLYSLNEKIRQWSITLSERSLSSTLWHHKGQ